MFTDYTFNIVGDSVDDLVVQGIGHVREHGQRIDVTAGTGIQAYGVNYILRDSRARLHILRHPISTRYLCRELLAYFKGSLAVGDGLIQASKLWKKIADENGQINSNYGYYVFRQETPSGSQYDWAAANLKRNLQSRRALININQPWHKHVATKDFPCTVGVQFLVREGALCCEGIARSVDVLLGLPYDIAFFSFLNELLYQDLRKNCPQADDLGLGYTMIRTSFTQIYDLTAHKADEVLEAYAVRRDDVSMLEMPPIVDAQEALRDIKLGTRESAVLQWIHYHAGQ